MKRQELGLIVVLVVLIALISGCTTSSLDYYRGTVVTADNEYKITKETKIVDVKEEITPEGDTILILIDDGGEKTVFSNVEAYDLETGRQRVNRIVVQQKATGK